MAENFEDSRPKDSASDSLDIGTRLSNEANVLVSGIAGSFSKIGDGLEEAKKDPLTFGLKVAGSAAAGFVVGAISSEAGFWGCLGRGTIGAFGVSAVSDTLKPLGSALSSAWNATSQEQLDQASQKFAGNLGQFEFDTLTTLPFAMGGSALGGGLRRSLAGTVSLQSETAASERVASAAKQTQPRMAQSTGGARSRSFSDASYRGSFRPQAEPKIYVGEIVDEPTPRRQSYKRPEPDIIDAEFTVISEENLGRGQLNLMKVRGDFRPELLPSRDSALTIAQREDGSQFALVARHPSLRSNLDTALQTVSRVESGWSLDRGILQSPMNTRITPHQATEVLFRSVSAPPPSMEQVIKAYTQSYEDTPHILDVKA